MKRKIDPFISKNIIRHLLELKPYQKWMKPYITARQFYRLLNYLTDSRDNSYLKLQSNILSKFTEKSKEIPSRERFRNLNNLEYLKLVDSILSCNSSLANTIENIEESLVGDLSRESISISDVEIFKAAIGNLNKITCEKGNEIKENNRLDIIAPVCPDYSTSKDIYGHSRYDFKQLGTKEGLVGKRLLSRIDTLKKVFNDYDIETNIIVLVGDFEATEPNCQRLGISECEFLEKVKSSTNYFKEKYGLEAYGFAEYFGGLESWKSRLERIRKDFKIKSIDSLYNLNNKINHRSIFISRIKLYERWTNNKDMYKALFVDQCLEYSLMGLMASSSHRPSILLASDHKAMFPYYTAVAKDVPSLSLNNVY